MFDFPCKSNLTLPKILFIALLVLVLILVLVFLVRGGVPPTPSSSRVLRPLRVGGAEFLVEVANTVVKRYKGLSGRESLAENQGMLFTFSHSARYPFCMRGMRIPLDFVWIRDGVVVEVLENVRPKDYPPLRSVIPKVPFDSVLEISVGTVSRLGLRVGDTVEF